MDLIIETDIGHDPDDFFAISYLIASGVNVRCILISPGDPDQIAIAKFLCKEVGLNIPIGASKDNRTKHSSGSIHHELLKKYNYPLDEKNDGMGEDILVNIFQNYPESELFIIGPVTSIGKYISKHNPTIKKATMQGGFLPYHIHTPGKPNYDFFGKTWLPTFNLNGDRPNGQTFLNANIAERRMVGKNVCHGVIFNAETFKKVESPKTRASELFCEAAKMYLDRHDGKKFHDPTAAACHMHPEIGTWIRGKTIKMEGGWTTQAELDQDYILADINYDQLWQKLLSCT